MNKRRLVLHKYVHFLFVFYRIQWFLQLNTLGLMIINNFFFKKKIKSYLGIVGVQHAIESKWFFCYNILLLFKTFLAYTPLLKFSFFFVKKHFFLTVVKSPYVFKKKKEHLGLREFKGFLLYTVVSNNILKSGYMDKILLCLYRKTISIKALQVLFF